MSVLYHTNNSSIRLGVLSITSNDYSATAAKSKYFRKNWIAIIF